MGFDRFNHIKVSTLMSDTEKYIERHNNGISTTDEATERHRMRVTRTVDGVPNVSVTLATFCEAIRGELRGIKFAYARRGSKTVFDGGASKIQTLWAYYPGDEYAVGMVAYADFAVSGTGDDKYCVYSRKIKNEKFADHRDQYYMSMSDSIDRAVKSAKKSLRRYSVTEVAEMTLGEFQSKLSSVSGQMQSEMAAARKTLFEHPSLDAELRSMVISGYQFNCPLLANAVRNYLAKKDEYAERGNVPAHGWFVVVRDEFGHQVFDVIEAYDIKRASRVASTQWATKTLLPNDVPDELSGKLAALSMLTDDNYVEGLGMRVSPTTYWVIK